MLIASLILEKTAVKVVVLLVATVDCPKELRRIIDLSCGTGILYSFLHWTYCPPYENYKDELSASRSMFIVLYGLADMMRVVSIE
jgi:hypothetical protein